MGVWQLLRRRPACPAQAARLAPPRPGRHAAMHTWLHLSAAVLCSVCTTAVLVMPVLSPWVALPTCAPHACTSPCNAGAMYGTYEAFRYKARGGQRLILVAAAGNTACLHCPPCAQPRCQSGHIEKLRTSVHAASEARPPPPPPPPRPACVQVPGLYKVRYIGQVGRSACSAAWLEGWRAAFGAVAQAAADTTQPAAAASGAAGATAVVAPCIASPSALLPLPPPHPADHPQQRGSLWLVPGSRLPAALRPESLRRMAGAAGQGCSCSRHVPGLRRAAAGCCCAVSPCPTLASAVR